MIDVLPEESPAAARWMRREVERFLEAYNANRGGVPVAGAPVDMNALDRDDPDWIAADLGGEG